MAIATLPRRSGGSQASFVVRDVLGFESMQDAAVLAGRSGLGRTVTGAVTIEVPDVRQWVKGGELLFSSGYNWRKRPEKLADLILTLDQSGVPGVVFKLGRYISELPQSVLDLADERSFPLIRMSATTPYRDVIEPLYERLMSRRLGWNERVDDLQTLTRFSLDDQSIEKVVTTVAAHLKRPVHVVNLVDEDLTFAAPDGVAWQRCFAELDDDERSLVDVLKSYRLRRSISPVDIPSGFGLGVGLIVGRESHGSIVVSVAEEDADKDSHLAIELGHAAELVSFLLLKRLALLEGRRQAASLFFASLMEDTLSNEEATERALTLGLRLSRPLVVLATGCAGGIPKSMAGPLRSALKAALISVPHVVAETLREQQMLVILDPQDTDVGTLLTRVADALHQVADTPARRVIVAAGTPRIGLEGLRQSRSEALIAYSTAETTRRSGLVEFAQLGVERLLSQISSGPMAADYVNSMLGPVNDDAELLRTLEIYLQHGGNKVATAAAIPMHRSSLMYRLNKLSEMLDADLNDPERCQELWLALRLRRIVTYDARLTPTEDRGRSFDRRNGRS